MQLLNGKLTHAVSWNDQETRRSHEPGGQDRGFAQEDSSTDLSGSEKRKQGCRLLSAQQRESKFGKRMTLSRPANPPDVCNACIAAIPEDSNRMDILETCCDRSPAITYHAGASLLPATKQWLSYEP